MIKEGLVKKWYDGMMESRIFMPFHSTMHKEPAQEHSSANFQKSMTCKVRTSADPEMVCRRTWSDSVSYNETGTEISLVQRKNSKTSKTTRVRIICYVQLLFVELPRWALEVQQFADTILVQTAEPHIASLLQLDRKMSSDSSKSEQSRSFWPRVLLRFVLFCSCVMKYFESFEHLHSSCSCFKVTGN